MIRMPHSALALALAAVALAGCLDAEVKASRVCASEGGAVFAPGGSGTISVDFEIDLSGVIPDLGGSGISGTVLMQQVQVSSTSDLFGIETLTVAARSSTPGEPPIPLSCDYQRPASGPVYKIVAPCTGPNLFDYVSSQVLALTLTASGGSLPAPPLTAEVGSCLSLELKIDYTEL